MYRTSPLGSVFSLVIGSSIVLAVPPAVNQSAREIPVAATVDVVVVGGSTGAVAAATAAAKAGAKVFLAAPRSPHFQPPAWLGLKTEARPPVPQGAGGFSLK